MSGIAGVCTVGTLGLSAGSDCVGGRDIVVADYGRIRMGGENRGREWVRTGRKSNGEGKQWIAAQEKERN
jgi:hypothetical protein